MTSTILETKPSRPSSESSLSENWDHFLGQCQRMIARSPELQRLSRNDREDCVQDVMVEVVRKFGSETPVSIQNKLMGWIRVVSRNKAVDIHRRRKRKPELLFDDGAGATLIDRAFLQNQQSEESSEAVSLVREALSHLDARVAPMTYLVFHLRHLEGWSITEISDLFQIRPERTRARCHRAKRKFEEILRVCTARRREINS